MAIEHPWKFILNRLLIGKSTINWNGMELAHLCCPSISFAGFTHKVANCGACQQAGGRLVRSPRFSGEVLRGIVATGIWLCLPDPRADQGFLQWLWMGMSHHQQGCSNLLCLYNWVILCDFRSHGPNLPSCCWGQPWSTYQAMIDLAQRFGPGFKLHPSDCRMLPEYDWDCGFTSLNLYHSVSLTRMPRMNMDGSRLTRALARAISPARQVQFPAASRRPSLPLAVFDGHLKEGQTIEYKKSWGFP